MVNMYIMGKALGNVNILSGGFQSLFSENLVNLNLKTGQLNFWTPGCKYNLYY